MNIMFQHFAKNLKFPKGHQFWTEEKFFKIGQSIIEKLHAKFKTCEKNSYSIIVNER